MNIRQISWKPDRKRIFGCNTDFSRATQTFHVLHKLVTCYTDLSRATQTCHVLHRLVTCYTDLSRATQTCHVLHRLVACYSDLSRATQTCHVLHRLVMCYTDLSRATQTSLSVEKPLHQDSMFIPTGPHPVTQQSDCQETLDLRGNLVPKRKFVEDLTFLEW